MLEDNSHKIHTNTSQHSWCWLSIRMMIAICYVPYDFLYADHTMPENATEFWKSKKLHIVISHPLRFSTVYKWICVIYTSCLLVLCAMAHIVSELVFLSSLSSSSSWLLLLVLYVVCALCLRCWVACTCGCVREYATVGEPNVRRKRKKSLANENML